MEQENPDGLTKMLSMQQDLMDRVPHDLRPDSQVLMAAGVRVIETLLLFLNSTGHKPWRPDPLPIDVQETHLRDLADKVGTLAFAHKTHIGVGEDFSDQAHFSRQLVSTFGVIEESIEYINAIAEGTEADRREELVDVFFFYLEQILLSGFSWEQLQEEYVRKHAVNLKRYEDAEKGDYSWDKRAEKETL